jgi:hypothetical protein
MKTIYNIYIYETDNIKHSRITKGTEDIHRKTPSFEVHRNEILPKTIWNMLGSVTLNKYININGREVWIVVEDSKKRNGIFIYLGVVD